MEEGSSIRLTFYVDNPSAYHTRVLSATAASFGEHSDLRLLLWHLRDLLEKELLQGLGHKDYIIPGLNRHMHMFRRITAFAQTSSLLLSYERMSVDNILLYHQHLQVHGSHM